MKARLLLLTIAIWLPMTEMIIGQENSTDGVVSAVAPIYPRLARLTGTSGKIRVEIHVDKLGMVTKAIAIREDPNSYVSFREISERTSLRWKFTVAKDEVSSRTFVLTFVYKIMPDKTPEDELAAVFHYPYEIEVRGTAVKPIVIEDPPLYHK